MLKMRYIMLISFCSFVLGVGVGSLRVPLYEGRNSREPVNVDFCFLLRNPDLIGSRRFITHASITPAVPHKAVLASEACPDLGASFTEHLDRQDFNAELNRRFHDDPYDPVFVEFEGTQYRPSLVRGLWFRMVNEFGFKLGFHRDQTAPIAIRAYKAIGGSGGQNPLESPITGGVVTKPSTDTLLHESGQVARSTRNKGCGPFIPALSR